MATSPRGRCRARFARFGRASRAAPTELGHLAGIYSAARIAAGCFAQPAADAQQFAALVAGEEISVAVRDGEVVGFISVWVAEKFIHHLYVLPAAQGKSEGAAPTARTAHARELIFADGRFGSVAPKLWPFDAATDTKYMPDMLYAVIERARSHGSGRRRACDGELIDLETSIEDGERIAVYPMLESFAVRPFLRLRPEPQRRLRFVADAHLGALARRLRIRTSRSDTAR